MAAGPRFPNVSVLKSTGLLVVRSEGIRKLTRATHKIGRAAVGDVIEFRAGGCWLSEFNADWQA
jgi:hypothetical protein